MDALLTQLMEFVRSASPIIWEAFTKQVYAQAGGDIAGAVIAFMLAILLCTVGRRVQKNPDPDYYGAQYIAWVFAVLLLILTVIFAVSAWMQFYNPNFYAIQLLLKQLR